MSQPEAIPNPDPMWVKETLVEDFCETQESNGVAVPSARENEDVVLETLRDLDQRESVAKPPECKEPTRERKTVDGMLADSGARMMTPAELSALADKRAKAMRAVSVVMKFKKAKELLRARWAVLMKLPEWKQRFVDAYILGHFTPEDKGGGVGPMNLAIEKILADSNAVFGDWQKEPEKKLIFA